MPSEFPHHVKCSPLKQIYDILRNEKRLEDDDIDDQSKHLCSGEYF